MDELLAPIRATFRRSTVEVTRESRVIEAGDFRVDTEAHTAAVDGLDLQLTPEEFELLVYFVKHANQCLPHRKLLAEIWGSNCGEQTQYLRVFIHHLRKKIEVNPAKPNHILSQPWLGYRFQPWLVIFQNRKAKMELVA